jgi:integrase
MVERAGAEAGFDFKAHPHMLRHACGFALANAGHDTSLVEQTIDHQLAQARAAGFTIDDVVADNGVSGVATRLVERPEGRRLFDKLRAGDV